ncbi:mCG147510 [Mus musculus]|jgi:hypothetical protein|nr:mCG147510 [Mus musculus]
MSYQGIYVTKEYLVHFEVVPGGLYLKNVLGTVFSWEGSNFRVRSFGVKSLGVFWEQSLDGRGWAPR